jgi:hypothetical protein
VPPKLYGGTERVVSWLTEELIALGHDVTLFEAWAREDLQLDEEAVEVLPDLPRHSALLLASIDRLRAAGAFRGGEDA